VPDRYQTETRHFNNGQYENHYDSSPYHPPPPPPQQAWGGESQQITHTVQGYHAGSGQAEPMNNEGGGKLSYDERMSQLVKEYENQTGRSAGPLVDKYRHATPVRGRQEMAAPNSGNQGANYDDYGGPAKHSGWGPSPQEVPRDTGYSGQWAPPQQQPAAQSGAWHMSASGQAQWRATGWQQGRGDGNFGFMSPLKARGSGSNNNPGPA